MERNEIDDKREMRFLNEGKTTEINSLEDNFEYQEFVAKNRPNLGKINKVNLSANNSDVGLIAPLMKSSIKELMDIENDLTGTTFDNNDDYVFKFELNVNTEDETIQFKIQNDEFSDLTSEASSSMIDKNPEYKRIVSFHSFERIRHELAMMCFVGDIFLSDKVLGNFFFNSQYYLRLDANDKYTPDSIFAEETESEVNIYVFELKTTSQFWVKERFEDALKYQSMLKARLENIRSKDNLNKGKNVKIYLGIVVVTENTVYSNMSNLKFFPMLVSSLCRHWSLGESLSDDATSKGFIATEDMWNAFQRMKMLESFKRAKLEQSSEHFLQIDEKWKQEFYELEKEFETDPNIRKEFRRKFNNHVYMKLYKESNMEQKIPPSLKTNGTSFDKRVVVRLPMIYPIRKDLDSMRVTKFIGGTGTIARMWRDCIASREKNPERFVDLTREEIEIAAIQRLKDSKLIIKKDPKTGVKDYIRKGSRISVWDTKEGKNRRAEIDTDEEYNEAIARDTVIGRKSKKYKLKNWLAAKIANKREWLHEDTDVSDIKDFIEKDIYEVMQVNPYYSNELENLYNEEILEDHYLKDLPNSIKFDRLFRMTYLGSMYKILGIILEEVNQSMKHIHKLDTSSKKVLELKSLMKGNILLLCKPTKYNSHMFYSVAINTYYFKPIQTKLSSGSKVFSAPKDQVEDQYGNKWDIYEFFTTEKNRISHSLCPYEEIATHWFLHTDIYDLHPGAMISRNGSSDGRSHIEQIKKTQAFTSSKSIRKQNQYGNDVIDAMNHFAFCCLMSGDPNNKTSENAIISRYGYMEAMSGWPDGINPEKTYGSLSLIPRRRLNLFFLKNYFNAVKIMKVNPPMNKSVAMHMRKKVSGQSNPDDEEFINITDDSKQEENNNASDQTEENVDLLDKSNDSWENIISWVNMRPIRSLKRTANLFYYGYIHNKDEGDMTQGQYQIILKMIEEELKVALADKDKMRMGSKGFDPTLKSHEWSNTAMFIGTEVLLNTLSKNFSLDKEKTKQILMKKMFDELIKEGPSTIATLKASAIRSDLKFFMNIKEDSKRVGLTRRLINGIIELMEKYKPKSSFYEMYDVLLKDLSRLKVYVVLFKKNQHGGPREIAIVDALSRVCILPVETFCRVVAAELPSDRLTTTGASRYRSDHHSIKVAKLKTIEHLVSMTLTVSGDCSRWAPSFVMTIFAFLLMRIAPKEIVDCFLTVLNANTEKLIEIPRKILINFLLHPNEDSMDPGLQRLKREWNGDLKEGEERLLTNESFSLFLKNLSNMLQGIFQFTSNMIHHAAIAFLLMNGKTLAKEWVAMGRLPESFRLVQDFEVNSDDSAAWFTALWKKEEEDARYLENIKEFLALLSEAKSSIYPSFCALDSTKKTLKKSVAGVTEFKSNFYMGNTHICPLIKFTYTAVKLKTVLNIEDRQNVLADHRRAILENGGSSSLASFVQWQQIKIHYKALGLTTNVAFKEYWDLCSTICHPIIGYFTAEPELISGVFGQNFAKYKKTTENVMTAAIHRVLVKDYSWTVSDEGGMTVDLEFHMGELFKWIKWLDQLSVNESWRTQADDLWYRNPETMNEHLLMIYKKATNGSSALHFSHDTAARVYSQSAFILQFKLLIFREKPLIGTIKLTEAEQDKEREDQVHKKKSLIDVCKIMLRLGEEKIKEADDILLKQNTNLIDINQRRIDYLFSNEDRELFFSISPVYDALLDELKDYESGIKFIESRSKTAFKRNTIPYVKASRLSSVPLNELILNLWFGKEKYKRSDTQFSQALATYQNVFPWFKSSPEATLAAKGCPFRAESFHINMADFSRTVDQKKSSFSILSPVKPISTGILYLKRLMKFNYSRFWIIEKENRFLSNTTQVDKIGNLKNYLSECNNKISRLLASLEPSYVIYAEIQEILRELNSLTKNMTAEDFRNFISRKSKSDATLLAMAKIMDQSGSQQATEEILDTFKMGIWGYFTTTQKRAADNERWLGPGVYMMKTDNLRWRITLKDEYVVSIEVNQKRNCEKYSFALSQFMNNNFKKTVLTTQKKDAGVVYDFGRKIITHQSNLKANSFAVEIIERRDLPPIGFTFKEPKLVINSHSISIALDPEHGVGVSNLITLVPSFGSMAAFNSKNFIFQNMISLIRGSDEDIKKFALIAGIIQSTNQNNLLRKFVLSIFNDDETLFMKCFNHKINRKEKTMLMNQLSDEEILDYMRKEFKLTIKNNLMAFVAFKSGGDISKIDTNEKFTFDFQSGDNHDDELTDTDDTVEKLIRENANKISKLSKDLVNENKNKAEISDSGSLLEDQDLDNYFDADLLADMMNAIDEPTIDDQEKITELGVDIREGMKILTEQASKLLDQPMEDDFSESIEDPNRLLALHFSNRQSEYGRLQTLKKLLKIEEELSDDKLRWEFRSKLFKAMKVLKNTTQILPEYQETLKTFITTSSSDGKSVILAMNPFFDSLLSLKKNMISDLILITQTQLKFINKTNYPLLNYLYKGIFDGESRDKLASEAEFLSKQKLEKEKTLKNMDLEDIMDSFNN